VDNRRYIPDELIDGALQTAANQIFDSRFFLYASFKRPFMVILIILRSCVCVSTAPKF
jgi:hypothetical protein